MSAETTLREAICRFGRSLFDRGLTSGSSGNISARLADGRLLATPTNSSLGSLDPARISLLDPDGRLLAGDPPTKELPLHTVFYETRPEAGAVVHLHSIHAVAVSMLPEIDPANVFPPLTAYYLMRIGRTALVPYCHPGDPAVTAAIRDLRGGYSAVLLANHGPVVAGRTLEAAVHAAEEMEDTARLFLLLQGRAPRLLTRDQIAGLVAQFKLDPTLVPGAADGPPDPPQS